MCVFDQPNSPLRNGETCESCPDDRPNYNFEKNECEVCPDEYPISTDLGCMDCAQITRGNNLLYWNPNVLACVNKCPDETPLKSSGKACMACVEAHPNGDLPVWDTLMEACISKCSEK